MFFKSEEKIDLKKFIPIDKYNFILKIGKYADDFKVNAYLVGGFVRDLLLGKVNVDLDITISGNGILFTKYLADRLDASYKCFEKFKTGKIFFKCCVIDITSARKELYKFPGALPEVDFSDLQYDLYRRDFTINAMAIQINKKNFGLFYDPHNGFYDLKNKIIRILNKKSFIDDPTRILRAVRFKTRFGFKIERQTEKLLKKAIKLDMFKYVSAERISNEIFLILSEKNAFLAFKEAQKYGVLCRIDKNLKLKEFHKKYFIKTDDKVLRFFIFIHNLNKNQSLNLVMKLKLSGEIKNNVLIIKTYQKKFFNLFKKSKNYEKELYDIFKKIENKVFDFFYLICENKRIKNYLLKIKNTKIKLTGNDIKKLGIKEGIEIGKIMDKIKYEKIIGNIKNENDEKKFIIHYLKKEI